MKKFLTSIAMVLLLVGCAKEYDDSGLKERIGALEIRVTALESSVQALQSAIGEGVFVAKVQEYVDPDTQKTIGITVTYTNGDVKYFQIHPKDNVDAPVLGVIKSGSGDLVWAVDGVAIQVGGEEVPVYLTPVFSLDEEGFLWVEVNGQKAKLGQVQNSGATLEDGIFTDLKVEQDKVVLTLSDGSTVDIPFAEPFKLVLELEEVPYVQAGAAYYVFYEISGATEGTTVKVAGYSPMDFAVEVDAEAKRIDITPLHDKAAAQMIVIADSGIGLVSTATLLVEPEGITIVNSDADKYFGLVDYIVDGEGDILEVIAVSNVDFEVIPAVEWIQVVSVKSKAYTITLNIDENGEESRTGTVYIAKAGATLETLTEADIYQTLLIGQTPAVIETGPTNLSKKGAANSYIVTEPGTYKFWAVKGNSGETVSPASVEVLWETWNNTEEVTPNSVIASVSHYGSYVVFSTPETLKPGNAVIAAKDAAGVILWSWHIWVPATPIEDIDNGIYSAPMMDRNLGALVTATADDAITVESFGLTYQWGRKDPFVGVGTMGTDGNATVAGVALSVTEGAGDADESKISLEQSIQNPTLMGHTKNKGWLLAVDNTLWQNEVKTMYDPCPPGYRVPARDKEQPFHSADLSAATGWAEATNWFTLGDPVAVFPLAGYRDDYSPKNVCHAYDRAVYWTAYASAEDGGTAYYVNVRKGSAHKLAEAGKSRAGSVRCVAVPEDAILPPTEDTPGGDDPVEDIVDLSAEGSANSYIVYAPGEYKFKAVKGNSDESVGTVAEASILWETVNTATAPEPWSVIGAIGYDTGGYIIFDIFEPVVPGNALIAAKDADGNILWSWHIWVPADEIQIQDGTALCGAAIMDRNLGALVATSMTGDPDPLSIGLNYQWGRKDPFPGIVSFSGNTGAAVAGEAWTAKGEHITTAYSIAHPTEYAHIKEVDAGVWNVDDPKDLWNTEANGKTIYDPCPAGYRVPLYDSSLPMWKGSFGDDWTIDKDNFRFAYGDIVFPVGGYIDCWTPGYAKVGERTHIWASKWYDAERSTCLYYRDGKFYSQKFHKAKAGSVRCVAE